MKRKSSTGCFSPRAARSRCAAVSASARSACAASRARHYVGRRARRRGQAGERSVTVRGYGAACAASGQASHGLDELGGVVADVADGLRDDVVVEGLGERRRGVDRGIQHVADVVGRRVEPGVGVVGVEEQRHPIVDRSEAADRVAREDREAQQPARGIVVGLRRVLPPLVEPRHEQRRAVGGVDVVRDLLAVDLLPLVVAGCRHHRAPLLERLAEHRLVFELFGAGVEGARADRGILRPRRDRVPSAPTRAAASGGSVFAESSTIATRAVGATL